MVNYHSPKCFEAHHDTKFTKTSCFHKRNAKTLNKSCREFRVCWLWISMFRSIKVVEAIIMEEICVNPISDFNAKGEKSANENRKQETKIWRNIAQNGKTKPSMVLMSNNRERRDEYRIIAKNKVPYQIYQLSVPLDDHKVQPIFILHFQ